MKETLISVLGKGALFPSLDPIQHFCPSSTSSHGVISASPAHLEQWLLSAFLEGEDNAESGELGGGGAGYYSQDEILEERNFILHSDYK